MAEAVDVKPLPLAGNNNSSSSSSAAVNGKAAKALAKGTAQHVRRASASTHNSPLPASSSGAADRMSHMAGRSQILTALHHLDETRELLRRYNFFHEDEKTGPSRGRKSVLKLSCVGCRDTKVSCPANHPRNML